MLAIKLAIAYKIPDTLKEISSYFRLFGSFMPKITTIAAKRKKKPYAKTIKACNHIILSFRWKLGIPFSEVHIFLTEKIRRPTSDNIMMV